MLYGTTIRGGSSLFGTIFRMNKDGSSYSILHNFISAAGEGQYPNATVVEGNDGRLYGTTEGGGNGGFGTVFVINKNGTSYTVLRQFLGGTDGANPDANLHASSDGLLYGTTSAGGASGNGTLFKINPNGSDYLVIKQFLGGTTDGANPYYAGVVEKNNVLYGVTTSGGTFNQGLIYSVNKDGSGYQVLVNFGAGVTDGAAPKAGLYLSSDGILYGTTAAGLYGTVFRFHP